MCTEIWGMLETSGCGIIAAFTGCCCCAASEWRRFQAEGYRKEIVLDCIDGSSAVIRKRTYLAQGVVFR